MAGVIFLRPEQAQELSLLVDDYLAHRVAQHTLSPLSARNHRSTLHSFARFIGYMSLDALAAVHIEAWMEDRRDLQPATRRAQFSSLKVFCRWLVRMGHIESNPVLDVASPRQPRSVARALESPAVARLLDECPDARARAIVWLMVGLGLRCCEIERLELGHWDRRAQVMMVRGKAAHERVLPVPVEVADFVDSYLAEYPACSGPLIRSYRRPSSALRADSISGMVSEWCRAAGIKRAARDGVSAHALRATAASDVLDNCGDLRVVQEMLGHQNIATTSIYLRRAGLPQMRKAMSGRTYRRGEPKEQTGDDAA